MKIQQSQIEMDLEDVMKREWKKVNVQTAKGKGRWIDLSRDRWREKEKEREKITAPATVST